MQWVYTIVIFLFIYFANVCSYWEENKYKSSEKNVSINGCWNMFITIYKITKDVYNLCFMNFNSTHLPSLLVRKCATTTKKSLSFRTLVLKSSMKNDVLPETKENKTSEMNSMATVKMYFNNLTHFKTTSWDILFNIVFF